MQGAWVWSLVRELKSYILHGVDQNKKKQKKNWKANLKKNNRYWVISNYTGLFDYHPFR